MAEDSSAQVVKKALELALLACRSVCAPLFPPLLGGAGPCCYRDNAKPVPPENYVRQYSWWSPPRIDLVTMSPIRRTGRKCGASLLSN